MTKKIITRAFLVTSMVAITMLMVSCANDKTFEGTWKRAEKFDVGAGLDDMFITFKGDKKVIGKTGAGSVLDLGKWSAKYAKKKLTVTPDTGKKTECKFKFAKNFKEVTLSSCDGDYKKPMENTWKKQ